MKKPALITLSVILLGLPLRGQEYQITGTVLDARERNPVAGVNVSLPVERRGTITRGDGSFSITVEKLPVHLYFSHLSYAVLPVMVDRTNYTGITVLLEPEIREIGEVTITSQPVRKIRMGDTLNIIDFDFANDNRLLLVANPYKHPLDKRLYLTDFEGRQFDNLFVGQMGKQIKIPEKLTLDQIYLFRCFEGTLLLITRQDVRQAWIENDSICLAGYSSLADFLSLEFVIRARLDDRLFFQWSNRLYNRTYMTHPEGDRPRLIKEVHDPFGLERYVYPTEAPSYIQKCVSAPCFHLNDEVLVFDFFDNHIEFFDLTGQSLRRVPIDFHLTEKSLAVIFRVRELNQKQFKQIILKDDVTGRFYALFQPLGRNLQLKEIDIRTGQVISIIDVPDFLSVSKPKVHGGRLYFLYQVKQYPGYVSLYSMELKGNG